MKKRIMILISLVVIMFLVSSCILNPFVVPKTVLIDDTHNNSKNFDGFGGTAFFAKLTSVLQAMGYTVSFTSSVGFFPENYGYFVVAAPVTSYSGADLTKVSSFLSKSNRKLILLGEWFTYYDNSNLNNILSFLGSGITFNNEKIKDNSNNYNSINYWPTVTNFVTHPVTTGLSSIALIATTSLSVSGNAFALAYTSAVSYLTPPLLLSGTSAEGSSELLDKEDGIVISGPFVVVAAESIMSGKVVAVGDATIFANDVYGSLASGEFLDIQNNKQLFINMINW